uniref:Uncharacterized protein n=1 Tax=Octopus bimaculoides TaxID=37653 RepID=A0A0L8GQY5_OCTBM
MQFILIFCQLCQCLSNFHFIFLIFTPTYQKISCPSFFFILSYNIFSVKWRNSQSDFMKTDEILAVEIHFDVL